MAVWMGYEESTLKAALPHCFFLFIFRCTLAVTTHCRMEYLLLMPCYHGVTKGYSKRAFDGRSLCSAWCCTVYAEGETWAVTDGMA